MWWCCGSAMCIHSFIGANQTNNRTESKSTLTTKNKSMTAITIAMASNNYTKPKTQLQLHPVTATATISWLNKNCTRLSDWISNLFVVTKTKLPLNIHSRRRSQRRVVVLYFYFLRLPESAGEPGWSLRFTFHSKNPLKLQYLLDIKQSHALSHIRTDDTPTKHRRPKQKIHCRADGRTDGLSGRTDRL